MNLDFEALDDTSFEFEVRVRYVDSAQVVAKRMSFAGGADSWSCS